MNKEKIKLTRYNFGEIVLISEGMKYYSSEWISKNGLLPGAGLYFREKTKGQFVKVSPDSGPLYHIILVNKELFEIFHKDLQKV